MRDLIKVKTARSKIVHVGYQYTGRIGTNCVSGTRSVYVEAPEDAEITCKWCLRTSAVRLVCASDRPATTEQEETA